MTNSGAQKARNRFLGGKSLIVSCLLLVATLTGCIGSESSLVPFSGQEPQLPISGKFVLCETKGGEMVGKCRSAAMVNVRGNTGKIILDGNDVYDFSYAAVQKNGFGVQFTGDGSGYIYGVIIGDGKGGGELVIPECPLSGAVMKEAAKIFDQKTGEGVCSGAAKNYILTSSPSKMRALFSVWLSMPQELRANGYHFKIRGT